MVSSYHATVFYYGTRAERTALSPVPDGAVYVESDTGGVFGWNGTSWVAFSASMSDELTSVTANYTATDDDHILIVDATGGDVTVTLPDANGLSGKQYFIKRTDSSANTVTVQGTGGDTIDDEASQTLDQYDSLFVISDSTEWWIL